MTLRTLKVPVGLQLVSGVRYGDSARSIILSAMLNRKSGPNQGKSLKSDSLSSGKATIQELIPTMHSEFRKCVTDLARVDSVYEEPTQTACAFEIDRSRSRRSTSVTLKIMIEVFSYGAAKFTPRNDKVAQLTSS